MHVGQDVFVPHELEDRPEFLVGVPELQDDRKEVKDWKPVGNVPDGLPRSAQKLTGRGEQACPVLEPAASLKRGSPTEEACTVPFN